MKISILSTNTGFEPVRKAWLLSRPNETSYNYGEVKKLDLPVNEFLSLTLGIECTIIEREIFTSLSNHVIWAQTSRVNDVLKFECDDSFSNYTYQSLKRDTMINLSKQGIRQDDYRVHLPLISLTKFATQISIRNLIKTMKYFQYLYDKTSQSLFYSAFREMQRVCSEFGYYANSTESYKMHKILCEDFELPSVSSVCGGFMNIATTIPMHLRAQLVRHRGLQVRDNLLNLIVSGEFINSDLTATVDIQVSGTIETFQEISSKRACWIAQYNIWSDFLNKVTGIIPEMKLPCSGGACPFSEDAMLRYEEKDPNPPCPIHCIKNDLKVSRDTREKMYSMIKSDNRDTLYWGDFVRATTLEE